MNLLWKKDKNGSYVDIFTEFRKNNGDGKLFDDLLKTADAPAKNDKKSTEYRQKGNEEKLKGNWYRAMINYNDSLRFAENDSPNLSLAYANRSLCFLKMEMYDKCIIDIDLAISTNYPKEKRLKLEERRKFCQERINTTMKIIGPTLDFEVNENYAGISNVLDIKYSKKYGRHVVANCDIPVGKTIFTEEAFGPAQLAAVGQNIICNTCCKTTMNFIPCKRCTNTLFCSEFCARNDKFHEFVCGKMPSKLTPALDMTSVLYAIDLFCDSPTDLMRFVENVMKDNKSGGTKGGSGVGVPSSIKDEKSKYRMFLQLNLLSNAQVCEVFFARAFDVFKTIIENAKISAIFGEKFDKHFLMHLCVLHTNIVLSNPFNTSTISGTFPYRSFLNHSCAPNIVFFHYENKSIGVTIRPIKKGAQIYMIYHQSCWATALNQQNLENIDFKCNCEKCRNNAWAISCDQIKSDADFQYIEYAEKRPSLDYSYYKNYLELFQRYTNILNKYANLPWSTEMNTVCERFELQLNHSCLFAPINFGNFKYNPIENVKIN